MWLVSGALAGAALLAATARPAAAGGRSRGASDHAFGLGITLGAPSGLAGKYFLGDSPMALDFAAGFYDGYYYRGATELHGDVLWHPAVLARTSAFDLPLYIGVGARFLDHHGYDYAGRYVPPHTHLGLRVPVGIAFELTRAPLDLFVELAPVWDFVDHHPLYPDPPYDDDAFDLTASFGLRYYF